MKKKVIIITPIIIALMVFIGVYVYFNHEDAKTSLTTLERKWISNNSDQKFDFEIVNNVPIYSMDGTGVIFDFINNFESDTGLEFNKISYLKENSSTTSGLRIRILNNDVSLTDNDLLIAEDGYVLISKDTTRYDRISDISDKVIGSLTSDMGEVSYFLKTASNLTYKSYDDVSSMLVDLENGTISMIVIPQIMYLDQTLSSDSYYINYYFTEMSKKIVLTLSDDNTELNTIVKKYYEKWKKDYYVEVYNEEYLKYYIAAKNINDKTKAEMLSKNYVYGYVENKPYEASVDNVASGIASEYIARLKRLTGIDITYQKYKTVADLQQAIDNQEVDFYFNYYGLSSSSYSMTTSPFVEEYVVLRNNKNQEKVTTFEELKGKNINMLANTTLLKYFTANSKANIVEKNKLSDLTKDNNLILVDKEVYNYYRNTKFSKYEVIYSGYISNDYNFGVLSSNSELYKLFNYIITTNSYYNYRINGLNSLSVSLVDKTTFEELYLIVLGIILLPLLILLLLYLILRNKKKQTKVRKEDRRKYTDILTSLKNRNYLNLNMPIWEDSKIYPQTIVVIDLNNIKYVNDNYGHEAGDNLIVAAASTLVNTQLENSEIIRTDGNEFLVYLVGYTEKQIDTYCKKLTKELKELPYGFGAAIGYSMIMDDIKTIDDAINEATLEMKTVKEELK
jgi:diguanylate cyclase (GGDEF)-like protein